MTGRKKKVEPSRKIIIGVIGGSMALPDDAKTARELGKLLASKGYVVLTGGLTGIMEEVSRGAWEKEGITVGILPGTSPEDANPYVNIPIVTGLSHARNVLIVRSADVIVAIGGGLGTLSEIAIALKIGKQVIGINTWDVDERIIRVDDATSAMEKIKKILKEKNLIK